MTGLRAGMTLTPMRVLVEQGPVATFAAVVGATDEVHRSPRAGAAAGFGGSPVPPTYPFVMWQWGAHRDLQPADTHADLADLAAVSERLKGDGGMMLHGEQEFEYHRPLLVGETVDLVAHVEDVSEKTRRDGSTMRVATVVTDVRGADGELVLVERTTLICLVRPGLL